MPILWYVLISSKNGEDDFGAFVLWVGGGFYYVFQQYCKNQIKNKNSGAIMIEDNENDGFHVCFGSIFCINNGYILPY